MIYLEYDDSSMTLPRFNVVQDGDTLMAIRPAIDANVEPFEIKDGISDILFFSPKLQTQHDVGVGTTLSELMEIYPDYSIYYNMMREFAKPYVEIPELPGILFYLNTGMDDLVDVELYDDAVQLTSENLRPGLSVWMIQLNANW